jgi:hypothetical protein
LSWHLRVVPFGTTCEDQSVPVSALDPGGSHTTPADAPTVASSMRLATSAELGG